MTNKTLLIALLSVWISPSFGEGAHVKTRGVFDTANRAAQAGPESQTITALGNSDSVGARELDNSNTITALPLVTPEIVEPTENASDWTVNCGCAKPKLTTGEEIAGDCVDFADQREVFGSSVYNSYYGSELPAAHNTELLVTFDDERRATAMAVKFPDGTTQDIDVNNSAGFKKAVFEFVPPVKGVQNPSCQAYVRNPGRAFWRVSGSCIENYPGSCGSFNPSGGDIKLIVRPGIHALTKSYLDSEYPAMNQNAYNGLGYSSFIEKTGFFKFSEPVSTYSNRLFFLHGAYNSNSGGYVGMREFNQTVELN